MTKERSKKWDNIKFFLILFVVFGHITEIFCDTYPLCRSEFVFIYSFHMPAFLFISGMFSKRTVTAEKYNYKKLLPFLGLWIILSIYRFLSLYIYNPKRNFNLATQSTISWFMLAMFVFYTVTWALKNVSHKKVMLLSILLSLVFGFCNHLGSIFTLSRIVVFYPFFYLGSIISREKLEDILNEPSCKRASFTLFFGILILAIIFEPEFYFFRKMFTGQNPYSIYPNGFHWYNFLIRLGLYPASFFMMISLFSLVPNKDMKLITKMGKETLSIYFWHLPIVTILYHQDFLLNLSKSSILTEQVVAIIISFLLCIIFSLKPFTSFIHWFMKCNKKKSS